MSKRIKSWPVRKTMCPSCPFREGGDRELAARVLQRTLFKASQICQFCMAKKNMSCVVARVTKC